MDVCTNNTSVKTNRIYLDYAATTPLDPAVWTVMGEVGSTMFGNPSSVHAEGRMARTIIEESRKTICKLINASLSELFFTSCGTEAHNTILTGAVRDLGVKRIISSPLEHHCILHTLEHLKLHEHVEIVYLPVNSYGQPSLEHLEMELKKDQDRKTLVSLMQVNNEVGIQIDLAIYGALCHAHNALFHSDTVQGIGFGVYDLQTLPIDFMAGSAHKFYGPKGTGFMYIRNDHIIQPLLWGGSQERNMRSGTENIMGIAGMSKAMELAYQDLDNRLSHLHTLRNQLKEGLQSIDQRITINGDLAGMTSPKILSANVPRGSRTDLLLMNLDIAGISASGGSACSSGVESASHVLSHLPINPEDKTVRFSFSHLTTAQEIDQVIDVMSSLRDTPTKVLYS